MANAKSGVIWSAIERFSVQGTQFILSLIIARLVTPADFGLIAMLTIFLAIAQVFTDSGFGNALIQKKDRTEIDFSTVFYFNIAIAAILYIILFCAAPLIANFYNQEKLTNITRWVGLNIIIQSFSLVQRTKLRIALNYKLIAQLSFVAMILSGGIGIILACKDYGVWSLVFQTLGNNALLAILFWIYSKWKPILVFSVKSFKRLFSFGSKLLASYLLHTVYLNMYSLVIGKFYNATDVGYYNRASTIAQYVPVNLTMIINNVIYPLQCERQNDKEWIISTFPQFLRITCYIVFPLMVGIAVLAKPIVLIILTEKWIHAVPLLAILSIAYMWISISSVNNSLITALGRSDLYLKAEFIKKIMGILILIATLPLGLIWLSIGIIIYYLFDVCLIIYYTKKIIEFGFIKQLTAISPILLLTCFSAIVSYIPSLIFVNSWIVLLLGSTLFTITYIGISILLRFNEICLIKSYFKKNI